LAGIFPVDADGEPQLPEIGATTVYLWGKIHSPLVEGGIDPETGKPAMAQITGDQMMEALYVLAYQDDPRVLNVIVSPEKFQRAVYEMTRKLAIGDLDRFGKAMTSV